jgi:small-conductance mechanosensitive channel
MHARELAELAALVAVHSPVIAQGRGRVPHSSTEQYWAASKCRLDRWGRLLRQLAAAAGEPQRPATLAWPRVRPVLEEILVTELLTRMWTAAAAAYDAVHGDQDLEPIARNILAGHLDARRRLLGLLADGRAIQLPEAVKLNHLRRRVERWNDMLLAHLAQHIDIGEFAFEPQRARDFAEDLDQQSASVERRFTCQLVLVSMRASFSEGLTEHSPNGDLNRRIGSAVLAAFRDEISDSTGLVKSLWLERISRTASDTEGMIEELLRLDVGQDSTLPFSRER